MKLGVSGERLICVLDYTECDGKCPSCRGDYALAKPTRKEDDEKKGERR